jgi:biopolymer transport protein ExbB
MFNECCSYLLGGGPVLYTIFAFSIIAWVFIFHKLMVFNNTGTQSHRRHDEIIEMAKDNRVPEAFNICKSNNGLYSKIIHNTLLLKGHTPHQFDMASSVNILGEKRKLEGLNGTIGLIASMCPLLGLLGTVMGMISTFNVIIIYGTGEPGLMGKGISQALITTQVGLFLAVPILFFYEFLETRKQSVKWEMERYIKKLKTVLCGNNGFRN